MEMLRRPQRQQELDGRASKKIDKLGMDSKAFKEK